MKARKKDVGALRLFHFLANSSLLMLPLWVVRFIRFFSPLFSYFLPLKKNFLLLFFSKLFFAFCEYSWKHFSHIKKGNLAREEKFLYIKCVGGINQKETSTKSVLHFAVWLCWCKMYLKCFLLLVSLWLNIEYCLWVHLIDEKWRLRWKFTQHDPTYS